MWIAFSRVEQSETQPDQGLLFELFSHADEFVNC